MNNELLETRLAEIQVDYNLACAKVGELSYTLHCVQAEIQKLHSEIKRHQQAAKKLLEKKEKASVATGTQIELPLEIPDAPADPTKL